MSPLPEWLDRNQYPFNPRSFNGSFGEINYVDEGSGPVILFLHGNPTWSFLYRKLIRELSMDFRCIAPDLLGFGLSEAPKNFSYTPEDQAKVIAEFIQHFNFPQVTLVVHDWGGPIGVSYALSHHEEIRNILVFNSFMWPVRQVPKFNLFSLLLGAGGLLQLHIQHNIFAKFIMPFGFSNPLRFVRETRSQYTHPLHSRMSRYATWQMPRSLRSSENWLRHLWESHTRLDNIPKLFLWGMQDLIFDRYQLQIWRTFYPDSEVHRIFGANHYVPEELSTPDIRIINNFLHREG